MEQLLQIAGRFISLGDGYLYVFPKHTIQVH